MPGPTRVSKEFSFEAAHSLPSAPEGHKCRRLHGHSFRAVVHIEGEIDPVHHWVVDFGDISAAFAPLLETLDHSHLNEIEGLENPTSEVLARWIWNRLAPRLPGLSQVDVKETCTTSCSYHGRD